MFYDAGRKPNFENLLRVLRRERPTRPTLFEIFMNMPLYEQLAGHKRTDPSRLGELKIMVEAFTRAGYDYATTWGSEIHFNIKERHHINTSSLNEGFVITDRASFDAYKWPDSDACDYSSLKEINPFLPDGMKLMVMGPGGVLENVTSLVGYDNMCYMLYEDPALLQDVFDAVGSRLVRHYEIAAKYDSVGLLMGNDDWGFNTQTFLSVADMRKYVFPWHKRICAAAHAAGKPVVLHSCGYMTDVFDDIIDDIGYDGKHSYEDNIVPVEESYRRWGDRIAIMGGIDVDFLMRSTHDEIQARCRAMLELADEKGGYALGSGNSIPEYIPVDKYLAMISCVKGE